MKKIEVVAGVLVNDDKCLCVQRPKHKLDYISEKFEFPGGKIEDCETRQEALKRELHEELNIKVEVGDFIMTVNHQYPDFELTMHAFRIDVESREIRLNEHIYQIWLDREDLLQLDWAAADIPIVEKLKTLEWESL